MSLFDHSMSVPNAAENTGLEIHTWDVILPPRFYHPEPHVDRPTDLELRGCWSHMLLVGTMSYFVVIYESTYMPEFVLSTPRFPFSNEDDACTPQF